MEITRFTCEMFCHIDLNRQILLLHVSLVEITLHSSSWHGVVVGKREGEVFCAVNLKQRDLTRKIFIVASLVEKTFYKPQGTRC